MDFYIADSFTDSIQKLNNTEQKIVKTTAFDLQLNPAHPSLKLHRIDKAKDTNFWSIRVNDDIRIILHKKENQILLCYVDHHDKAYSWAEKRKIEIHPKTGSVQIVCIPEILVESSSNIGKKKLFKTISKDLILACGVPDEWVLSIQEADEDSIFEYLNLLPAEAGEALLDLVSGKKPNLESKTKLENPFEHPDSKRRFKLVTGQAELEEALNATWSKWAVFLHPLQRNIVEKDYNGPVRVSGSAGTGKTVVALHRATFLAKRNPEAKVLLATFSPVLVNFLHQNFIRLASTHPSLAEQVEVITLEKLALRFWKRFSSEEVFPSSEYKKFLIELLQNAKLSLTNTLVFTEILMVLDEWNLKTWEDYKDFKRQGKKTRLRESHRKEIWDFYEQVKAERKKRKQTPLTEIYHTIAEKFLNEEHSIFDAVILDEAQDLTSSQMKFVSSLSKSKQHFFFTGDLGQRIFQIPFSWQSFGMDIRGRSFTLKVNYRTSEQIRKKADQLLDPEISDFDGNLEKRKDTISLFQGPSPQIEIYSSEQAEIDANQKWLESLSEEGIQLGEILIIVRSEKEISRVTKLLEHCKYQPIYIEQEKPNSSKITVSTMHGAKGLEFRVVLIMGCDSNVIPSNERLNEASDESELGEIYAKERHLLYVACTRARDLLRITGLIPGSEFLGDLK
jgi:mRNA-degrading endonuclease RelE of RelBE toxin-antitoxin system